MRRDRAAKIAATVAVVTLTGSILGIGLASSSSGAGTGATVSEEAASPYGAHAMIYLNMRPETREALFAEAARLGVGMVRVDVQLFGIFPEPGRTDWTAMDDVARLADRYDVEVLGMFTGVPHWAEDCPDVVFHDYTCPPADYDVWASWIGGVVERYRGTIHQWEVWNEPDLTGFFAGTPDQYARMLSTAYDAVKAADPGGEVLFGGLAGNRAVGGETTGEWFEQVVHDPSFPAAEKYDVANVHVRGPLDLLPGKMGEWRKLFEAAGFDGPLWVTEHSYPADPAHQTDPDFAGGEESQAAYLQASLPLLLEEGAGRVFVTLRDLTGNEGPFRTEGVVAVEGEPGEYVLRERASFDAVAGLIVSSGHTSLDERSVSVRRTPGRVGAGGEARVHGRIEGQAGCEVLVRVNLKGREGGARLFRVIGRTTSDLDGAYEFVVSVEAKTEFRAVAVESGVCAKTSSRIVTVRVGD